MDMDRRTLLAAGAGGATLLAATADAATPTQEPTVWYGGPAPDIPRAGLRWAFSATVFFAQRTMVDSPVPRGFTWAAGGRVWGPRLNGRVLPYSGADYYRMGFYTHYMLEADDGALIHIHNRGTSRRFRRPYEPGVPLEPAQQGDSGGWTRFRVSPVFEAPSGRHDWMNHTVFVGSATIVREPIDHTEFHYFEIV